MAKKIKKSANKSSELLSFIKQDKEDESKFRSEVAKRRSPQPPSKRTIVGGWNGKNVHEWSLAQFIGFYLHNYFETFNREDPYFKVFRNDLDNEKKSLMFFLRDFFDNDKAQLKKYIIWLFKWWISAESFVSGYPTFHSIFSCTKPAFYNHFLDSVEKNKKTKTTKKTVKRKDNDNSFASKNEWDNYFEGEE